MTDIRSAASIEAATPGRTIALVTGGNKGIGRAIVEQFANLGMTVVLAARDRRRGEAAAGQVAAGQVATGRLAADGADVRSIVLDVTAPATIAAAVLDLRRWFGRLDVLVNNAGISGPVAQAPGSVDVDEVRRVFETNVFGVIRVTNAMLPLLRRSRAPRIVNVTSGLGSLARMSDPGDYFAALPASAGYPPSKTALNALTVQYAKELRAEGVLVNAVDPGPCATDFTKALGSDIRRTATHGAAIAVRLATIGPDGPTGGVFSDAGTVPW